MTDVYFTVNRDMHGQVKTLLKTKYGYDGGIEFVNEKKPQCTVNVNDGGFEFNITHSGEYGAIAVSKQPVGIDLEIYKRRNYLTVSSHFPLREQNEINCEHDFLIHWTAREAFIKMKGATIAEYFKRIEFYGGKLYVDGLKQNCKIIFCELDCGILTVCGCDEYYNFNNIRAE